jgi:hypothetical protein
MAWPTRASGRTSRRVRTTPVGGVIRHGRFPRTRDLATRALRGEAPPGLCRPFASDLLVSERQANANDGCYLDWLFDYNGPRKTKLNSLFEHRQKGRPSIRVCPYPAAEQLRVNSDLRWRPRNSTYRRPRLDFGDDKPSRAVQCNRVDVLTEFRRRRKGAASRRRELVNRCSERAGLLGENGVPISCVSEPKGRLAIQDCLVNTRAERRFE